MLGVLLRHRRVLARWRTPFFFETYIVPVEKTPECRATCLDPFGGERIANFKQRQIRLASDEAHDNGAVRL